MFQGEDLLQTSGAPRRENAKVYFLVIASHECAPDDRFREAIAVLSLLPQAV
jgi:hypothetical protein